MTNFAFALASTMPNIEISDPTRLPSEPLVSVYMLTYNHERYIAQAIEGVISQHTDFPVELIIGEDCSTDSTGVIVRDYQKRYPHLIRILTSARNVGAHANAVRCRSAARGEFVAICEGDDYWNHTGKLQLQIEAFAMHPNAHLVHTDYDRQIGTRVLRNVNRRQPPEHLAQGDCLVSLLCEMTVTTSTAMYKRKLLEDYRNSGIDASKWPFGDYPIALYAALFGPVIYIPESTSVYRYVQGSAMNQGYPRSLHMQKAGLDCRRRFMKHEYFPDDAKFYVESVSYKRIMRMAAFSGNLKEYNIAREWIALHNAKETMFAYWLTTIIVRYSIFRKIYLGFFNIRKKLRFFIQSSSLD
jgi:glycosyltransferase involved in cell wall biosynthesis